ncbi:hypothetical protein ACFSHR_25960 [Azotobacter chroococcum]
MAPDPPQSYLRRNRQRLPPTPAPGSCEPGPCKGRRASLAGGLMGYLSYDFARRLERLPDTTLDDLELPDAQIGLYAWALISDHQSRTTTLVCHPSLDSAEGERLRRLLASPSEVQTAEFHRRRISRQI